MVLSAILLGLVRGCDHDASKCRGVGNDCCDEGKSYCAAGYRLQATWKTCGWFKAKFKCCRVHQSRPAIANQRKKSPEGDAAGGGGGDTGGLIDLIIWIVCWLIWIGCSIVFAFMYKSKVVDLIPVMQQKAPTGVSDMPFGLFECCSNGGTCLHACCCGACRVGHNVQVAGLMGFWPAACLWTLLEHIGFACCLAPCLGMYFRSMLRQKLGLAPNCCMDCLSYFFCAPCAIGQDAMAVDFETGVSTSCCCQLNIVAKAPAPAAAVAVAGVVAGKTIQVPVPPAVQQTAWAVPQPPVTSTVVVATPLGDTCQA